MPELETLMVANHAEALNGLLYLSGAGWTDLRRPMAAEGPAPFNHFGIAVSVRIPWDETNQRYHLTVIVETDDGREVAKVEGDVEVGRPAGIAHGSDLRTVMAVNMEIQFPSEGGYRVVATIADAPRRSVSFRVHDIPLPPPPPQASVGP